MMPIQPISGLLRSRALIKWLAFLLLLIGSPVYYKCYFVSQLLVSKATAEVTSMVTDGEENLSPSLEERIHKINRELRCVVCQNQSIDESDADMARDMRSLIRRHVLAGDSDTDITQFLVNRYGDFITLMPPLKPSTWVLWASPALFLLLAVIVIHGFLSRSIKHK